MTIYSHEYLLYNCTPKQMVQSKYWGARVRSWTGRVDMTGLIGGHTTTANSQAAMIRIPAGTMIVGGQAFWEGPTAGGGGSGLGVGTSISIGDAFDCDRFLTATATVSNSESTYGTCGRFVISNANAVPMNGEYLNVEYTGVLYQYTCDSDILLTLNSGPATGAQGHVRLVVYGAQE